MGLGQQPPGSIQGVVFAAPMAHRFVLDAASALVELGVGQTDQVERVGHLGDVGEGVVEGLAIGAGQVQHPEPDRLTPARRSGLEPAAWPGRAATGHNVEDLGVATSTIDVHHCSVRQRPWRQNNVSSRPSARTVPMRAGSSTRGVP
jgi:hypothetical protein